MSGLAHARSQSPAYVTRRDFLRITAMAGGAALIGAGARAAGSLAPGDGVTRSALVMGTLASLTVFADGPREAATLAEAALEEMRCLESLLTRFGPESSVQNVAWLNRHRSVTAPSPELGRVIAEALGMADRSRGAFDPTVLPAVELARVAAPGGEEMERARDAVGARHVVLGPDGIRLAHPRARVTLDAIGKGYVVDRTVGHLKSRGLDNVLVEAGGDLATLGVRPGRAHWRIGVRDPRSEGRLMTIDLDGRAVATSGDYQQNYSADFKRHHLIDPNTCRPALKASSATVIAPDCMRADALSTAAFVLGPRDGIDFLASMDGVEGLIVDRAGRIARTKGFPAQ